MHSAYRINERKRMKKFLMLVVAAAVVVTISGCGSLRTPSGENNKKVYYNTFFGISIESLAYGDGLIVKK